MSLDDVHRVDDDETVSLGSKDSTTSTGSDSTLTGSDSTLTGSDLSRDSVFSAKRISLTRELQNLRRQVNERMRCESDERFMQAEALGRCLEEERAVRVLKHEAQDDRISELESSQKQLGLEQKAQSEQIELALNTREIEELGARIDSLSRTGDVCHNELMELAQRFEETSADCNVKFDESHARSAEDRKICQNNKERCSQLEELMQRFETQISDTNTKLNVFESGHLLHTHKIEGQNDRIAELESQKRLDLEQKAQSEQMQSEYASCTREIEGLRAQIDVLSRNDKARNNDLMELTQRFEKRSAELNVEFEKSHTWRAEVVKICEKNNDWCSQLEAFHDQFELRLASERKTCQELIEAGVKSHASGLQDLSDMFDARIEDLTSRLDAGYADRAQKQEEQNQAEIPRRTLETALAEEISLQKTLLEAESIWRMEIAQSSDRESTERNIQLQNLESRVKAEIKTCADTIQEHKTQLEAVSNTCESNSSRIEELARRMVVGFAAEILPKCFDE